MDLILWRHAEAEPGFPDLKRALTPRGLRQAAQMAAWLKARLPDDAVLVASGAKRSQQTLSALSDAYRAEHHLNPGARPQEYLAQALAGSVVIVGHQPEIGQAASLLLTGTEVDLAVKKGAIWWFREKDGEWQLKAMLTPDLL